MTEALSRFPVYKYDLSIPVDSMYEVSARGRAGPAGPAEAVD